MQNPRQLTRHKQRHQKAKTTGKNAMQKLQHIFNNNRLNIKIKIRIFNACVESILLYNSDLWTLTKTAENKIDSYHRRILRGAINIRWPNKISCEDLYNKTKTGKMEWKNQDSKDEMVRSCHHTTQRSTGKTCTTRRKVKKLRGGQTTTWLAVLERDLDALGLTLDGATELANDRDTWRGVVWRTRAPCACALRA